MCRTSQTIEELKEQLADLYHDISGGDILGIRKVAELVVSRNNDAA